jgi:tetratricopeptide (TPR) repeat protein
MNAKVLRRFVVIAAAATVVMFGLWGLTRTYLLAPPGDYEVRKGDIYLSDRAYEDALAWFDKALAVSPGHRGALMGRAIVLLQTGRDAEAEAAFSAMIEQLPRTLTADDPTGRAVLAGAFANRGILYDRTGRYAEALADYRQALTIDAGAVAGPDLVHRVLYGHARPSTVEKRARYLAEQLALPAEDRVLRMPDIDARQRMYKP